MDCNDKLLQSVHFLDMCFLWDIHKVRFFHFPKKGRKKIGATGFEPATSRPPAERATKLRHTPKILKSCRNDFQHLI